jgi:D-3-phosphoglycerate dehydrogenase / 2-oxoglutarate reductase
VPGPAYVPADARRAMGREVVPHRSAAFREVYERLAGRLPGIFRTAGEVYLATASSTFVMEAAVVSLVERDVLNVVHGAFSERWHDVCRSLGRSADRLEVPWGRSPDPDLVRRALERKRYEAVTVVHSETSTGALAPLPEIAAAVREESDALFLVDAVSSLGGAPVETDAWGLDVVLAGTQKALAAPPGLTVFTCSERAAERAAARPHRGFYTDLLRYRDLHRQGGPITTPAVNVVWALDHQVGRIVAEGIEARWERHAGCAAATRRWADERGFGNPIAPADRSPTVTCLGAAAGRRRRSRAGAPARRSRLHRRRRLRALEADHLPHRPHGRGARERPRRPVRQHRRVPRRNRHRHRPRERPRTPSPRTPQPGGAMTHRILIADPIDAIGREVLERSGAEVHQITDDERPRLAELLPGFDALVVRSMTKVTRELLAGGGRLKVIGRAGIGVDNVDVAAATERGILVVNAPTANVLSATEHTFALLLALARKVPAADRSMKSSTWDRKSFVGSELHGKTLGVIGFGRIGQGVALRARAFEMEVVAFDPFLDAAAARRLDVELLPLDELLARADVVTLHTPLTEQTRNLLDARRIGSMKPGALLINAGRGGTVDEAALLAALEDGRLAGAALDVFAAEPPEDWALAGHPRVVATPHIGAQTREAQERIATETAEMVIAALEGSLAVTAVNLPFASTGSRGEPYLALGEQVGGLAGALAEGGPAKVSVDLWGIDEALRRPLSVAVVKGILTPFLGEMVNYVNAERVAEARGIELVSAVHSGTADYPHLVAVTLRPAAAASRSRSPARCSASATRGSSASAASPSSSGPPAASSSCATSTSPASSAASAPCSATPASTSPTSTSPAATAAPRASARRWRCCGSTPARTRQVLDRLRALPEVREARLLDLGPGAPGAQDAADGVAEGSE